MMSEAKSKFVYCFYCENVYSKQSNLNRHLKEVHRVRTVSNVDYLYDVASFKCLEGCEISFKHNIDLRNHLKNNHDIGCNLKELEFSTLDSKFHIH